MNIPDEEIDRIFQAAFSAPGREKRAFTAQEIAVRENILRGAKESARKTPNQGWAWGRLAGVVASIVAVTVVAVNVLAPTETAAALTPPPLEYSNAQSLTTTIKQAQGVLAAPPQVGQKPSVESLVWGWNIDMAKEKVESVPQIVTFAWSPQSGSTSTIVAGEPYWADGERPEGIKESPYQPGDLIAELHVAADDLTIPAAVVALDASSASMNAALAGLGITSDSTSGEVLDAATRLLSYWTLSDEQQAILLDRIVEAGGITVLGETTDRLGREVVGLRVEDESPDFQNTVLVSTDTGRIVGVENERTTSLDFVPAGVIGYTLWDVD